MAWQVELPYAIYSPSRRREYPKGWKPLGLVTVDLAAPSLLVAIGDAASREVVRGYLHDDAVARKNPDVVHTNLARDGAEDGLAVLELDVEHCVRQRLDNRALKLYCVLLAHAFLPSTRF